MKTILDNCQELKVDELWIEHLTEEKLIYYCEECGFYHLSLGVAFIDIESRLEELREELDKTMEKCRDYNY